MVSGNSNLFQSVEVSDVLKAVPDGFVTYVKQQLADFRENFADFYHLLSSKFFQAPPVMEKFMDFQMQHFRSLSTETTTEEVLGFFGKYLASVGVPMSYYYALLNKLSLGYLETLSSGKKSDVLSSTKRLIETINLLTLLTEKYYLEEREKILSAQAEEFLEISSPILKISNDILAVPVVGTLDSRRSVQIMDAVLEMIEKTDSRVVILDIMGVPYIDTATGSNLIRTVQAIELMGSYCLITGVRPKIAKTIVELGINTVGLKTKNTFQDGLLDASRFLDVLKSE